mgnify:CR=1 FL=1
MSLADIHNIPFGRVYSIHSQEVLSFKSWNGKSWYLNSYTTDGKKESYIDSDGYWCEYFYDQGIYVDTHLVYCITDNLI